jgi:hypothetical protein
MSREVRYLSVYKGYEIFRSLALNLLIVALVGVTCFNSFGRIGATGVAMASFETWNNEIFRFYNHVNTMDPELAARIGKRFDKEIEPYLVEKTTTKKVWPRRSPMTYHPGTQFAKVRKCRNI